MSLKLGTTPKFAIYHRRFDLDLEAEWPSFQ
jgi:hypothetical protein